MQLNNETYHLFTASITGPVTVNAVFNVQDSTSDAVVNIDEITPTNYNGVNVTNPLLITGVSVTGSITATVAQTGTNGIEFDNPASVDEVG